MKKHFWCVLTVLVLMISCGGPSSGPESSSSRSGSDAPTTELDDLASDDLISPLTDSWKGDLDGMIERRAIRTLVIYNSTNFFFDEKAQARGISHDALMEFEKACKHIKCTGLR